MKIYWDMYWAFFRIGGMTFGGGYAMFPMMKRELIERFGWITEEELLDYYAIGQCTPGIIAVNTATFVGNKMRGLKGALVATLGMVSPSLVIIMSIAAFIQSFAELEYVRYAFSGIRVVVVALILDTVISLWKKGVKGWFGISIVLMVLAVSLFTPIGSIWLVVACALLGILRIKRKGA